MKNTFSPKIDYAAEIKHVKEVMLFGTANFAFWQNKLREENLSPYCIDGKAAILLSATELKYMGLKFRELICSVYTNDPQKADVPNGFFLVHAFNSSRLFAFSERTMFQTPYYHGQVEVNTKIPASFRLNDGHGVVLNAKMSGVIPCSRREDQVWEGPIYLPKSIAKETGAYFFAKLGGESQVFPFSPSMDTLELKASSNTPALQWLIDSNFTGTEWRIRQEAEHSKSKTYRGAFS